MTPQDYQTLYQKSVETPEAFWGEQAQILDWIRPFQNIKDVSFRKEDFRIRWFYDGTLNVCANCVDRHLKTNPHKIAFIFERNESGQSQTITYQQLYHNVCRFANVLKKRGLSKGDVVSLYMPMIPEAIYAMLACARLGIIHSVVFAGFSANALAGRLDDCEAKLLITAQGAFRGVKSIPLKETVDQALTLSEKKTVQSVLVVPNTSLPCAMMEGRDYWYSVLAETVEGTCPYEEMDAEDPLFILYTSGSTGKPKGVLHTSGGYLVYVALTFRHVFDHQEDDIYWCTADIGWVTGHSYGIYGPLANGATSVLFEGIPTYPTPARFWEIIDAHKVSIFYTAPTAIRALMGEGNSFVETTHRSSLRLLGSVGEPLNPQAWEWYYTVIGKGRCPIMDTWWQTETGGIILTPLAGVSPLKPGSVSKPFFGIEIALLSSEGQEITGEEAGSLVLKSSWPGQMRGVYKNPDRFFETYFSLFANVYTTGDGAWRDKDGDFWIIGRLDDVINVSGHRLGTAEIEAALNTHPQVAESAVIGIPHVVKGQGIYAFILLKAGEEELPTLKKELLSCVSHKIGAIAKPDHISIVPALPKTRSGKIMRRVLRKLATGQWEDMGDLSTLANPEAVEKIIPLIEPL